MRVCQLCGAASWGPVKDPDVVKETEATVGVDGKPLLECDGCGSLAREDLITSPQLGVFEPVPFPFPALGTPQPFDYTARELLKGLVPEKAPETRTERLVRELIRSHPRNENRHSSEDYARWLVFCASCIEAELDARDAALKRLQHMRGC
jgi:hypothetical protein